MNTRKRATLYAAAAALAGGLAVVAPAQAATAAHPTAGPTVQQRTALRIGALAAPMAQASATSAAAERNYMAGVCGPNNSGKYDMANVGGWNQHDQFVHTPNFWLDGGSQLCGIQEHWWFKPHQTLEINVRGAVDETWHRFYRKFDNCSTEGGWKDRRWCTVG
ncbi:hypothetical protein ACWDBW_47000 [Streptomyces sp. NPDC001107]